jgi:sugar lactone lactonase YvrE
MKLRDRRLRRGLSYRWLAIAAFLLVLVFETVPPLTVESQSELLVGYAQLEPAAGEAPPIATALFAYGNADGTLVSEAGVAAVTPFRRGRIFVETGTTRTGVALVNPSAAAVEARLTLRRSDGLLVDQDTVELGPGVHRPRFVDELFGELEQGFTGSLTFEVSEPSTGLAAVTIRQATNAYGEPLLATLPVVDLDRVSNESQLVFPHVGAGEILSTQLVLINPTSQPIRSLVELFDSEGLPLELELNGDAVTQFPVELEAHGVYRGLLTADSGVRQGYAVVRPESDGPLPEGTALFQFRNGSGSLISEAGVSAVRATRKARIFVDTVGTQTGVALANRENAANNVTFRLFDRFGQEIERTSRTLAAGGKLAIFARELFEELPEGQTGILEIDAEQPVVPVTLKLTINARQDPILTTLPVADLERLPQDSPLVIPQVGFGLGFLTRLILLNGLTDATAVGQVHLRRSDGTSMAVPIMGEFSASADYDLLQGGAQQLRPGNTATAALIVLDATGPASEVVVTAGRTRILRPLIVDTKGEVRDDFPLVFVSLDEAVAAVDSRGMITAKAAGFSTLTLFAGDVFTRSVITVEEVETGRTGLTPAGLARDTAGRLYLTDSAGHSLYRLPGLSDPPQLYAGVSQVPGLKNAGRLESLFNFPSFINLNKSSGELLVSDSANHVVRLVDPGPTGRVSTLAGNGDPGAKDGDLLEAQFLEPSGILSDEKGNIWIADTGSHTIRRIDARSETVETVAGSPGKAGFLDGVGGAARFSAPTGLALESETLSQQLAREAKGLPPARVSVLVADRDNGAIRRVWEDGQVETVLGGATAGGGTSFQSLGVQKPTAVAVDPVGNIYVTDTAADQVSILLTSGQLVPAAEPGQFEGVLALEIGESGQIYATDASGAVVEIAYGRPVISQILPNRVSSQGGDRVIITGSNFSSDSVVVVPGAVALNVVVEDTQSISFTTPQMPSGMGTLTVQNRAGIAQTSIFAEPTRVEELPSGYVTTIAGGASFADDGALATTANLHPNKAAIDREGNILIADIQDNRVRRIDVRTGIITTIAGSGFAGFSGDGGPAVAASLQGPSDVAIDDRGNILIADTLNNRIRRVDSLSGIIDTVAGSDGFNLGDGGPAVGASIRFPEGIALDRAGNFFIADTYQHRVRRVDAATGRIATVAGNGVAGFSGDGGPGTQARLGSPTSVAVDSEGNLFIAEKRNHVVRRLDSLTGRIETVAGSGSKGFAGDGGPAAESLLDNPSDLDIDPAGRLLIADTDNHRIRVLAGEVIETVVGGGRPGDFVGDGELATDARLAYPRGLAVDSSGSVYVADSIHFRMRKVDGPTGRIETVGGNGDSTFFFGDGEIAAAAALSSPQDVAFDATGNLYIADTSNNRVRRVDSETGRIETVAGNGEFGFPFDGDLATETGIAGPQGIALDLSGNLYISNSAGYVYRVDLASGELFNFAGGGFPYDGLGDGGAATSAALSFPSGLAIDPAGNLLIADTYHHRIRVVNGSSGIITTLAGGGNPSDGVGDGLQATAAALFLPQGVGFDNNGNVLIADSFNSRIRRVDAVTKTITTAAGAGLFAPIQDGVPATESGLAFPFGVSLDNNGNMLIADTFIGLIRRVDAGSGLISTIAGGGPDSGFPGDDGPAREATLNLPYKVAVDKDGNLFIADSGNDRIRVVRAPIP